MSRKDADIKQVVTESQWFDHHRTCFVLSYMNRNQNEIPKMQERPRSRSVGSPFADVATRVAVQPRVGDKLEEGSRYLLPQEDHAAEDYRRSDVTQPPPLDELVDIHSLLEDPLGVSLFRR